CEANVFIQQKISTPDKTSLQAKALFTYQQLLDFHLGDTSNPAYVDVDLERLKYIRENAVFANKDQQYLEVLQNTAESLKGNESSALYQHQIALLYHEQGNTYQPDTSGEHRWKQKEALDLCESVIAQFPKSQRPDKRRAYKSEI